MPKNPKHIIEREAPKNYRVPDHIPDTPKFKTILVDFPWPTGQGGHYGAITKYDLVDMKRLYEFPLKDLADENCTLWMWTTNACLKDALAIIDKNGFTYRGYYVWCKAKLGLGSQYLRQCTELCLVATKGKVKFNNHSQMNWGIMPTTIHSEKPREFVSIIERLCDGPYLELFCRKRPASNCHWYCWGRECGDNDEVKGSDIFIPEWPVPRYSWEHGKPEKSTKGGDKDVSQDE